MKNFGRFLFFMGVSGWTHAGLAGSESSSASSACSSSESWSYSKNIGSEWKRTYDASLLPRAVAIQSFGEGWALRASAENAEEKLFSEYWTSRALYSIEMTGLSHAGFASIAARKVEGGAFGGIRLAALECLLRIQERYPTLTIPDNVVAAFDRLPQSDVLDQAVALEIRKRIGEGRSKPDIEPLFARLQSGGPWEKIARIWMAAHTGDQDQVIQQGRAFLATQSWPRPLERYIDTARLILARALYTVGQYKASQEEFKKISKSSNVLAHSLSDLAWAQLRADDYADAIGTAVNLQSGGLRRTFTPESVMVMAMSFNELCHYPESLRAVEHYRKSYSNAYNWLQSWKEKGASSTGLYSQATAFLRKEGTLPEKVATEWIRSPHFIARQDEIQMSFQYPARAQKARTAAADLQRKMARELLEFIHELKPRYDKAKAAMKDGDRLPNLLEQDLGRLKSMATAYKRLRRAAGPWRSLASHQEAKANDDRKRLVKEIEKEASTLNLRMLLQLDEIAENLHFLEVEIYEGATQDIIWQNAHPDYKELVMTFKKESRADVATNWNWGSVQGGFDGTHEIWEDELGSFKAELFDNCSSKDRYLSVKKKVSRNGGVEQ
jgi:hypothetical protein